MIKIKNLYKSYDGITPVLKNINLTINKGEIIAIVGDSGSGKSTLLRCINQLEKEDQGEIIIEGRDICKLSPHDLQFARKNMSMIFQSFNLFHTRNVFDNVAFPLNKKEKKDEYIFELLKYVGLENKANDFPKHLSGGQKQRVAIARALSTKPKILLSDEASSALDPKSTDSFLNLLKRLRNDMGLTIVLVSHEMDTVIKIADRVAVLNDGKIDRVFDIRDFALEQIKLKKTPLELYENSTGTILRLFFKNNNSKKAIISNIIKNFNVDINILEGNIQKVADSQIGHLTIELSGSDRLVAIAELNKLVEIEVLK